MGNDQCEIPPFNGVNILQRAQQTRSGPNVLPRTGSTVRKLSQAEYAQAEVLSGTCARSAKTQADSSNNVSAVSSIALACMF